MPITMNSPMMGFTPDHRDRFSAMPANTSPATAHEAENRKIMRTLPAIVAGLLDIACVLLVYLIASQLAERANVSALKEVYISVGALLASVPLVLGETFLVWRRKA